MARHGDPPGRLFSPSEHLPVIGYDEAVAALRRLTPAELEAALRERVFPVAWSPHAVLLAAAGQAANERAWRRGQTISAMIAPEEFMRAILRVCRKSLIGEAVGGLRRRAPSLSAHRRLTASQSFIASLTAAGVACLAWRSPNALALLASCVFAVFFLAVIALRFICLLPPPRLSSTSSPPLVESQLPQYTVLVPLFRETSVLDQLLMALAHLDYPRRKLDIKLVLEESDIRMRRACAALDLPEHVEIILVPAGQPQTKPKALAYALPFARGELLTIFDAEDVPEPSQLRVAAAAFASAPPHVACLQAALSFYNPNENWLTRQFAIEYAALFDVLLPALACYRLPLPLGGTSNHFRTAALRFSGGWDPYNVTEDADLGLRLARLGFASGVIDARTYEEANCQFGNWLSQRSRWLKGWMQTWLVHMRHPIRLYRDLGFQGFIVVQTLMLGVPLSALLHPFFIIATLRHFFSGAAFPQLPSLLVAFAVGTNLTVFIAGYGVSIAMGRRGLRKLGIRGWGWALATMPFYWLLISLAAWRALWEFIRAPFRWNKTKHGISRRSR